MLCSPSGGAPAPAVASPPASPNVPGDVGAIAGGMAGAPPIPADAPQVAQNDDQPADIPPANVTDQPNTEGPQAGMTPGAATAEGSPCHYDPNNPVGTCSLDPQHPAYSNDHPKSLCGTDGATLCHLNN